MNYHQLPSLPSPGLLGERRQSTVTSPVEVPTFIIAGKKESKKMSRAQPQVSLVSKGKQKQDAVNVHVILCMKLFGMPLINLNNP